MNKIFRVLRYICFVIFLLFFCKGYAQTPDDLKTGGSKADDERAAGVPPEGTELPEPPAPPTNEEKGAARGAEGIPEGAERPELPINGENEAPGAPAFGAPGIPGAEAGERPPESAEPEPELTEEEKKAKADQDRLVELDIKTSTLDELAEWCRDLGLGEGGSRGEMESRIRNYYKIASSTIVNEAQKIITIEKAKTVEYFTLETVGEDYARLSGGVELNLKDGSAIHKIKAWEIVFNRTRNIMTATGGVEYTKDENGSIEKFSGESITINLDTWVGNFIDSIADYSSSGNETSYRFAGEVISMTDSETTVLKNAHITTSGGGDEPYWSVDASRLWLMPGNDFAIANLVLKVGEVPIFWFPFFPYPVDEVVFHPVLGTKTREGAFVQTTTYIMGRTVADTTTESSITSIMGSNAGMQQERHGVFLRTTKKRETDPNTKQLKILLDAYSNLGFYTGFDFKHPGVSVLKNTDFSFGLGWTRTIFQKTTNYYIPFDLENNWSADNWNSSYFFGQKLPFRYRMNLNTSISGKFGSLSLKFPLYSDPFIDTDLITYRSEQFSLFDLLTTARETVPATTIPINSNNSYSWSISASPTIPKIKILDPYISTISISSISSSLSFVTSSNRYSDLQTATLPYAKSLFVSQYSPERQFYRPDKLTAYSISGTITGTPLTIGGSTSSSAEETPQDPLGEYGEPISPWASETKEAEAKLKAGANALAMEPPALSQAFTLGRNNSLKFTAAYSITPSSSTELQYNKLAKTQDKNDPEYYDIYNPQKVDWSDFQSILTKFETKGSTTFTLSEANNSLFTTTLSFDGDYQWLGYSYIDKDAIVGQSTSSSSGANAIKNMYSNEYYGRQWNIYSTYNFTLTPFYWSDVFKTTNFTYNVNRLRVAQSLFNKTQYDTDYNNMNPNPDPDNLHLPDPIWDLTAIWDADFGNKEDLQQYLSDHALGANINMNILDKSQSITFSSRLPPFGQKYTLGAKANVWITTTTISNVTITEDTESDKETKEKRMTPGTATYDPAYRNIIDGYTFGAFSINEALNFGTSKSLTFTTIYDPQVDKWTSISTTFTFLNFTAKYTMTKDFPYILKTNGWVKQTKEQHGGEADLIPTEFTADYSYSTKHENLFGGYLTFTPTIKPSLTFDLQRFTQSKFVLVFNLTLCITKFLDFTMGANVKNEQIYWYFPKLFPDRGQPVERTDGFEQNIFIDLLNSFRFDRPDLRKKSGFKLTGINFTATHHLGDWDAMLEIDLTPQLDQSDIDRSKWYYWFQPTISFSVKWVPLGDLLSTQIDYQNDVFTKVDTSKY